MAYIGAMPTNIVGMAEITFTALESASISKSPYTHDQQVFDFNADMWMLDITLPPMKRDLAEAWVSFLLRCRGPINEFTVGDPNAVTPQGAWRDIDNVAITGSTGDREVVIASDAGFTLGDYFQLGSGATARLHKILESGTDGDTVEIYPCLRGDVSAAAATVEATVGRFRLASPATRWSINSISSYGLQFSCMEVLP